jgi:hypothetical protein
MTTSLKNPFRPTRWEQHFDGRHLIWYSSTSKELIGSKSAFVYGSRGSGKTTLLRGICWEDLSRNESLRLQKTVSDFDHLGVYVRFPDHMGASFSEKVWRKSLGHLGDPEIEFHRAFSLLVEAASLEKLLNAVHELRKSNDIIYSPDDELRIVSEIFAEFPKLSNFCTPEAKTFADVKRCFRSLSRETTQLFGRGDVNTLWELLPPRDPYELLSFVCDRLSDAISSRHGGGFIPLRFKFCLDDCEVLDQHQRKSLNTLVRQSRHPISWVVASVGKSQWAGDTFINSQPLTDADRIIVSLDRRDKEEFGDLCQAVTSMRLLFSLPAAVRPELKSDGVKSFFDFSQRLGDHSVNYLMKKMVRRSSKIANDVRRGAAILQESLERDMGSDQSSDLPPYYEAYTLMHWNGGEHAFSISYPDNFEERLKLLAPRLREHNFSAWLRRKQVAALLQFSTKASLKRIPLSGSNYIVSLADGSIRDYLEIIAEVFDEHMKKAHSSIPEEQAIIKFCESRTKISDEVQTRGIYQASERYFEGISNRHDVEGDLLTRIVSGLSHLTSMLQASPSDSRVLAMAERGVFMFTPPSIGNFDKSRYDDVVSALRQAELAGYLRPVFNSHMPNKSNRLVDGSVLVYRLHKRFAPKFKFSYRGAYEPFRIGFDEIYDLFLNTERGSSRQWAQKISGLSGRDQTAQYPLPFDEGSINEE